MNEKKAKALRRAAGYHPMRDREYHPGTMRIVKRKDVLGKVTQHYVTGCYTCTGARAKYKRLKRDTKLAAKVLEANRVQR